jgi:hypothetical protein
MLLIAVALAFHVKHMGSYTPCHLQHIQEKARKEVLDIMGDGDDIIFPTSAQCTEMKYTYMVMKEVKVYICP